MANRRRDEAEEPDDDGTFQDEKEDVRVIDVSDEKKQDERADRGDGGNNPERVANLVVVEGGHQVILGRPNTLDTRLTDQTTASSPYASLPYRGRLAGSAGREAVNVSVHRLLSG